VMTGAKVAADYGSSLSRTAWAGILMSVSFILLLTGFFFSLSRNDSDDNSDGEKPADKNEDQPASAPTSA